jgi:hypothetical protein
MSDEITIHDVFAASKVKHAERRPWAEAVKATAVEMAYADPVDLHKKLSEAGWTAKEAHFIIQAAAFYVDQKAQTAA